jgi:hypothetical protein
MKKSFLKIGLFLAMGLVAAMFYACDKDEEKQGTEEGNGNENGNENNNGNSNEGTFTITATNVINSSSQIVTLKLDVIAQAPYKNNGFTLELPATVSVQLLNPIIGGTITESTVSDKTAKWYVLKEFDAYNKDDVKIGRLLYVTEETVTNGDENGVSWFYVDKNVTIKGEGSRAIYDMDLKKGWNVVYVYKSQNIYTFTTSKPSGYVYNWYFKAN